MHVIPLIDQEFKALIPPLTKEERIQLEQNILLKRRCRDAIVLWQGLIIDGHNRYEICIRHGIEFEVKELPLPSRDDAKLWILENQLGRRNICEAARIEIVQLKAEILECMARKNQKYGGRPSKQAGEKGSAKVSKSEVEPIHVHKIQADEAGTSERNIYNYNQLKKEAHPYLLEKVQSGEVKIGTAHRMLTKEIIKKLNNTDKMFRYIAKIIPPQGLKAANPHMHAKLSALADDLRTLISTLEERRKS